MSNYIKIGDMIEHLSKLNPDDYTKTSKIPVYQPIPEGNLPEVGQLFDGIAALSYPLFMLHAIGNDEFLKGSDGCRVSHGEFLNNSNTPWKVMDHPMTMTQVINLS